MQKLILFIFLLFTIFSCKNKQSLILRKPNIQRLIENLEDSKNKNIIVVAHRGDWRNAPENSLQAIENCIKMGVDMVEIDIQQTKDGHLILMHDNTIDRTTKYSGLVKDWNLEDLKNIRLVDGLKIETNQTIPTLEEALLLCKDRILVNLDKSYDIFDKCYEVVKEFGQYLDKIYFMPIIRLPDTDAKLIVDDYLDHRLPIAFEFTVKYDTIRFLQYFDDIRNKGTSVWVNSLWPQHNGGHDDEKAYIDPTVYDWFIKNNIDIIQTDRPQHLLDYLRAKGLHD